MQGHLCRQGDAFGNPCVLSLDGHTSQLAVHRVAAFLALAHVSTVRRRINSVARTLINLSAELPDPVARETRTERAGMVLQVVQLCSASGDLPVAANSQGLPLGG